MGWSDLSWPLGLSQSEGQVHFWEYGQILSSLSLLECFVLTWHPADDVPVTCLREGFSPSQGVVRSILAAGTFSE